MTTPATVATHGYIFIPLAPVLVSAAVVAQGISTHDVPQSTLSCTLKTAVGVVPVTAHISITMKTHLFHIFVCIKPPALPVFAPVSPVVAVNDIPLLLSHVDQLYTMPKARFSSKSLSFGRASCGRTDEDFGVFLESIV